MTNSPDWSAHYRANDTPWDLGGPHPELSSRLQDGRLAPPAAGARVLVPGAGAGHDALALARRGWRVTAIDLVEDLKGLVGPVLERHGGRYVTGDAIEFDWSGGPEESGFDLVWDHTFFCAIHPDRREPWGQRAASLVRPGGRYVSLVFPIGKLASEGGPPFGMDGAAIGGALGSLFKVEEHVPVSRPVARRQWREHWLEAVRVPLVVS